jgi:AcrR family transcriptional regulator
MGKRRGWDGSPPADDTEARKKIIDAALVCIERRGPAHTTLSDVAVDLGITRRTVYRYFATTEELFTAVAEVALDSWIPRIEAITSGALDVTDLLVELVAHIIEELPNEPLLTLLLASDHMTLFSRQMLQPPQIARARTILRHTRIDWAALGYDDAAIDELVEFLLRNIQSMIIAPPEPPRTGTQLRAYLRRWIAPAFKPST